MEGNVRMAEKALAFAVAALIDLSPESTYKNYFSKLNRSSFASLDMCLGVSSFGTATAPETKNLVTCSTVMFSGITSLPYEKAWSMLSSDVHGRAPFSLPEDGLKWERALPCEVE